jgi:hypothetical protein
VLSNVLIVDVFASILFGWQFEDSHVRDGQPAGGSFERDIDELEVCHEGKDYLSRLPCEAHKFQVHNTHIGTAKKSTKVRERSSD